MRYKEDGDDAIKRLDRSEYGHKRRLLRVEWAQHKESDLKRDTRPSKTLFVVNFDVRRTNERDVERHFAKDGKLTRVQIKKNYAFVQFPDV
ncbi:Arginine/serine-rich-splicing factor RSP31, partial [Tetrabaena socialis]